IDRAGVDVVAQHAAAVAAVRSGQEGDVIRRLELPPSLRDRSVVVAEGETAADTELGAAIGEVLRQLKIVLADVIGRRARSIPPVPREADERRNASAREEL